MTAYTREQLAEACEHAANSAQGRAARFPRSAVEYEYVQMARKLRAAAAMIRRDGEMLETAATTEPETKIGWHTDTASPCRICGYTHKQPSFPALTPPKEPSDAD